MIEHRAKSRIQLLPNAQSFCPGDEQRVDHEIASTIVWLDGLVQNPDRTVKNPNLLWAHNQLWLVDHGGVGYLFPRTTALVTCNDGHVGGRLWFCGPNPEGSAADAGVHHIRGPERKAISRCSQPATFLKAGRIPSDLLWIMDDPSGHAICLAIRGPYRGCVYFWDHECERGSGEWDGAEPKAPKNDTDIKRSCRQVRAVAKRPLVLTPRAN